MRKLFIGLERGTLIFITLLALFYSLFLAVNYAAQPPLDVHSFRQTQTALTAYWFVQQGFSWAYETPVGGVPWAIPFEFPLYQLIVAQVSQIFDINLNATGRLTSYAFLLLIIFPVREITKKLKLPNSVFIFFVAIFFSMPVYVYWGRSFMIETAALFFGIAAIKYFLDYLLDGRSFIAALIFVTFSTLCLLQKATTALPILAVLSIILLIFEVRKANSLITKSLIRNLIGAGSLVITPILIGFFWVVFTDNVKLENQLGEQLTSAALHKWNWGTVSQRFSSDFWIKVIWDRIFTQNLGAIIGVFLLTTPLLTRLELRVKFIALSALSLGLIPLFIFTNLHIVHDYYQTANVIFLAYGLAITLSMVIVPLLGKRTALFLLTLILLSNYSALRSGYLPQIKHKFTKENRDLAIGKILMRELPSGMQFIAYGNDWSSTFAYISERKSFTVPGWFSKYDQTITHPEKYLEEGHLGGVVSCSTQNPSASQILSWAEKKKSWKVGETHGCLIATPEKEYSHRFIGSAQCQGNIDKAEINTKDGKEVISIAGWMTIDDIDNEISNDVLLKISSGDGEPVYLQALKVPRLDANRHLGISNEFDVGFSRIFPNNLKPGIYQIEILQGINDKLNTCDIRKIMEVE